MTTIDRDALEDWYREAMGRRMRELVPLRADLTDGVDGVDAALRAVGHALRGSGGSYGFPEVTEAGVLLEECAPEEMLRRVDGALSTLARMAADPPVGPWEWLGQSAGLPGSPGGSNASEAWARVAGRAELSGQKLAAAVADRYHLSLAALDDPPARAALRLVPRGVARRLKVLPLREDGKVVVVATANPVDPTTESELARLTGRRPRFVVAHPDPLLRAVADTFPEDGEEGGGRETAATGEGEPSAPTVLALDDDPVTRLLITATLKRKGYRVLEGGDGAQGLRALEEHPEVDLVVVDLEMPVMGGRDFLAELRSRSEWRGLPVVVVTGAEDPLVEADLIEAGADDYIHKPLDPRLFLARVAATLRRSGS